MGPSWGPLGRIKPQIERDLAGLSRFNPDFGPGLIQNSASQELHPSNLFRSPFMLLHAEEVTAESRGEVRSLAQVLSGMKK